ncbi:S24 family peptidase [Pseudomonas sp. O64]|uniref:S24 family peptidase n=1 Tax=unclassified Pseudomonas TaxID=196821 RepID=UPI00387ABC5F
MINSALTTSSAGKKPRFNQYETICCDTIRSLVDIAWAKPTWPFACSTASTKAFRVASEGFICASTQKIQMQNTYRFVFMQPISVLECAQKDLYYPLMTKTPRAPSPLASLFKARRKAQKLSQVTLAERVRQLLGPDETFSQQTYAAFEAGGTQNTRFALQIAQALGISMDEVADLSSTTPSPLYTQDVKALGHSVAETRAAYTAELHAPLIIESDSSGEPGLPVLREVPSTKFRFDRELLSDMGITARDVVCMKVEGSSMDPVLPDGSTVGIDRGKQKIRDGDIYAVSHGGHLRVKMLYKLPLGGVRMRSFNRDEYPDEEYSPDRVRKEEINIVGRIFWYSVFR